MSSESAPAHCYTHRNHPAEMQCSRCLEYICEACTLVGEKGLTCPPCLQKSSAQKRKRTLLFGSVAAAAVAGIVVALVLSQPEKEAAAVTEAEPVEAEPEEPGFDYGRYGMQISNLRATRRKNPCAKRVAIDLGNKLNAAGDYQGAKELVAEFFDGCESYSRLLWVKTYAHEQLGEWSDAAEIDTELIDEKPYDSDFWWWRGKAHAEAGNNMQAKADFRQSMAAKPNKFAAARYARYFGDDEPCQASFTLSFYAEQRLDQQPKWATRDAERLYLSGDCDKLAGKGQTSIKFKDGAPLVKTRVKVNGVTGTFAFSAQTGFVTINRAFADEAGIEIGTDKATVFVGEAHQDAAIVSADVAVGKTSAAAVATAIVSELPMDVDGILGASFLARFAYDRMPGEIALVSRTGE